MKFININNSRLFSKILNTNLVLNPWWVTGFCDAEASFTVSITKSNTTILGYTINPCFIITLHLRDIELIKNIQCFFKGIGKIYISNNLVHYKVRSRDELNIILDHFKLYPLCTSKFKQIFIFNYVLFHKYLIKTDIL